MTPTPSNQIVLTVNGEPREVAAEANLAELVAELSAAPAGVAAAVNEAVVPRSAWTGTRLTTGDRVEILTAVQGG